MFRRLWQTFRYWKCKWDYSRLSPKYRRALMRVGQDPESLKKQGAFD